MSRATVSGAQDAAAAAATAERRAISLLELPHRELCAIGYVPRARTAARRRPVATRGARLPPQAVRDGGARRRAGWKVARASTGASRPWHKLAGHPRACFRTCASMACGAAVGVGARPRALRADGGLAAGARHGAVAEQFWPHAAAQSRRSCTRRWRPSSSRTTATSAPCRSRSTWRCARSARRATCHGSAPARHRRRAGRFPAAAPLVARRPAASRRSASLGLSDEEMRKRLDTTHEFFALVSH